VADPKNDPPRDGEKPPPHPHEPPVIGPPARSDDEKKERYYAVMWPYLVIYAVYLLLKKFGC